MKIEFLKKESENTRLILIFAGWSAGPEIGRGIDIAGWDVAVVHDFTSFEFDKASLEEYYTIYLFAWSLGIYASAFVLPSEKITAAFAVNGTLSPVDDELGIPLAIFKGTADNLTPRNLMKFRMRMMADRQEWERNACLFDAEPDETRINNLQRQLFNFIESTRREETPVELPWVRAYLSEGDRIFPADNMHRAWQKEPDVQIVETEGGHFPDLKAIVEGVISDSRKVSEKFTKASVSYDTNAIAQYSIAIHLASKLMSASAGRVGSVLEIGCGTGLFTREYAPQLKPEAITFVDIIRTGPFGVADTEEYVTADAEDWLPGQTRQWDAIVSASCMQWFADPERFLHECFLHLRPGGVLAVSTFLPGNLGELDELRPSPLLYPSSESLCRWLEKDFEDVSVESGEIRVEFQSVREMLMHLKHTGVAGSSASGGRRLSDYSHLRNLTYLPVYLTARKPGKL